MKCWICGDEANSGEHLIKASDIRSVFGSGVTQKSPLYFHTSARRNHPVGGIKSDKLKYNARICGRCNNERTQAHDRAWERLSLYLRSRQPPIQRGTVVRLDKVFPGSVRKSMLGVHLFFLKQFGCLIAEHSIPLDIRPFAESICSGVPHPNVHLAFWSGLDYPGHKQVARTHVQTAQLDGRIAYAGWFYIVDRISVNVIYAEPTEHRKGLVYSWHPSSVGKRVHIVGT